MSACTASLEDGEFRVPNRFGEQFEMNKPLLKLSAYALYFLCACFLMLLAFFPSEELETYLEKNLSDIDPRFKVSIERIAPALPFGVKAERITLEAKDEPGSQPLKAERLSIGMPPWRLLRGEYAFDLECGISDGRVRGKFSCGGDGISGPVRAAFRLEGINLKKASVLAPGLDGIMAARADYHKGAGPWLDGSGEAEVALSGCRVASSKPLAALDTVQLEKVDAAVSLHEREVELHRLILTGKDFEWQITGRVQMQNRLDKSRLRLKGKLSFAGGAASKNEQKEPLAFQVEGSLGNPDVRLIP